jgi:hypothetical protein
LCLGLSLQAEGEDARGHRQDSEGSFHSSG